MVEAYQNIVRHKLSIPYYTEHPDSRPAFVVRSNDRLQSLVAINAIPNAVRSKIEERVAEINSMDSVELKRIFLEGLEGNAISEKGGAGLGLIEMARRSKNKLGCRMVSLNEEHSMFFLAVIIGDASQQDIENVLDTAAEFRSMCIKEDLLLLHKGELSASAVSALLPMVQRDMDETPQKASVRSRAYLAAIEVFRSQKVNSHGIFSLCRTEGDYFISVGQELEADSAESLRKSIEQVNQMSKDQLDSNFRRALLSQEAADKELRGLLDLAICSKEELISRTETIDGTTFFNIQARI